MLILPDTPFSVRTMVSCMGIEAHPLPWARATSMQSVRMDASISGLTASWTTTRSSSETRSAMPNTPLEMDSMLLAPPGMMRASLEMPNSSLHLSTSCSHPLTHTTAIAPMPGWLWKMDSV